MAAVTLQCFPSKIQLCVYARYLRSGLTGISEEETDCLEDYVLALGIRGHSKWTKVWTAKMQGMTDEELDRINGHPGTADPALGSTL